MSIVYVATVCPLCKKVNAMPYARGRLVAMLTSHEPVTFHSECHNVSSQPTFEARRAMIEAALAPFA
jgi:hypothetical protein